MPLIADDVIVLLRNIVLWNMGGGTYLWWAKTGNKIPIAQVVDERVCV